ncbi:MAG: tRNA pseudouridine(38-40) synthase TruA, partial [Eggerthellaceae bacterium]|nr:tRNA pseudouridine(38-40) synthase TruA [Eggerthellaceae bacterium]
MPDAFDEDHGEVYRPSIEERSLDFPWEISLSATIAYRGTHFNGFAKQPGMHTVQGDIEEALSRIFQREVGIVGAGRTDAGVHARRQVISFGIDEVDLRGRSLDTIRRSLQNLTDDDIIVYEVIRRPKGFSARFDAKWRQYKYFIKPGEFPSFFGGEFTWWIRQPLDVELMGKACSFLLGTHDFKSFCKAASAAGKNTVRTIYGMDLTCEKVMGEEWLCLTVTANAFLHSMIRIIVGCLVKVGRGQRSPEWMREVLDGRDRRLAAE